jgi:hypothetical protein
MEGGDWLFTKPFPQKSPEKQKICCCCFHQKMIEEGSKSGEKSASAGVMGERVISPNFQIKLEMLIL